MKRHRLEPKEFLPLTPAMFHILVALADGEKHGYAILKEVSRSTNGKVQLSVGTLYGIIKRLDNDGMIIESAERPDPGLDDERRRYYRLSDFGREIAVAEAERMEEVIAIARAKNLLNKTQDA